MANPSGFLLVVSLVLTALIISLSTVDASVEHHLSWVPTKSGCQGSMAECMANDEFEMDSEISRRILQTTQYISYGALQRNTVPCSQRGASYYNCQPGAQANPYNRGCSQLTRCRS
ncbi:hypothetical protein PTKIN_Ptkin15bG0084000 [Pterospermum kingtungense]